MNNWNDGYFTDSTYTYGYYSELNPIFQRFCLLVNGVMTSANSENNSDTENQNHCELGFGQGVSVNIHAAANPGNYFGTDFNPSHATHANLLCQASGSGAKLFEDSFEEMLKRDDLPKFDSISLHGIWSWISAENQRHIVEFVRKFLKVGGILYNSYNCYPGWSPAAPLRELFILHDKYAHQSSKTFNRVEDALNFTEKILSQPQGYFSRVPDVKQIFERTKKHNHDYLAHEYFNRDWICMYFSEVAEMFQAAKVDFVCTASLIEQKENMMFPQDCLEILNSIENPIMREQVKDYFLNRQFRKDLSVRGGVKLSPTAIIDKITATTYVMTDRTPFPEKISLGKSIINLNQKLIESLTEYFSADNYCPKNLQNFFQKVTEFTPASLTDVLILLVNAGKILPCQDNEAINKTQNQCYALNKHICERAKFADEISYLASPVTGGGVALNRFERIFTAAIFDGKNSIDEIADYTWKIFKSQAQVLTIEGKQLLTAEENIAEIQKAIKPFLENRLPVLKTFKVV